MKAIFNVVQHRSNMMQIYGNNCPGHLAAYDMWLEIFEYFQNEYNICPP